MAGGPGHVAGDEAKGVQHVGAEDAEVVGSAALVAFADGVHVPKRADGALADEFGHAVGPGAVAVLVGDGDLGSGGVGCLEHGVGFIKAGGDGLLDVDAPGAGLDDIQQPASVVLEVMGADGDEVG